MVKRKKTSRIEKLLEQFHIVLVNKKTLERRQIFTASRLQIILTSFLGFMTILSLVFLIIYFTPLKEYFRGYTSTELRESSFDNAIKLDSLEKLYLMQNNYISSVKDLLAGKIEFIDLSNDSIVETDLNQELDLVKTNTEDSILRAIVQEEDKYNPTCLLYTSDAADE